VSLARNPVFTNIERKRKGAAPAPWPGRGSSLYIAKEKEKRGGKKRYQETIGLSETSLI